MKLKIRYDDELPINAFRWTPRPHREAFHFHDSLEIGLCLEGKGTFLFSDKAYAVHPGDVFVVNNLELHVAQSDPDDPSSYLFLNFDSSLPLAEDEALLMPFAYHAQSFTNCIPASADGAGELARLVTRVHHEMTEKPNGYRAAAKSALLLICVQLLRILAHSVGEQAWNRTAKSFAQKRRLLVFMDRHYQSALELPELAAFLKVSESSASRRFRQLVGRSFREHLNALRVHEAKRRLVTTDASVTDVCFSSGFQSLPSFYRVFHDETGLAPQDFRNNHPAARLFDDAEIPPSLANSEKA